MNKAQLTERGRHYFDNKEVTKMYATPDGNFFYENSKNYADSHAKTLKTQVITITRADLVKKVVQKEEKPKEEPVAEKPKDESESKPSEPSIDELRGEGKRLKIPKYWIIKEETLKQKIAEANGTT